MRWVLTLLLGGLGLLSLVVEPASRLLAGGSVAAFLGDADALMWVVVLVRGLHIGAVLAALVAMYRPAANAFFRTAAPAS